MNDAGYERCDFCGRVSADWDDWDGLDVAPGVGGIACPDCIALNQSANQHADAMRFLDLREQARTHGFELHRRSDERLTSYRLDRSDACVYATDRLSYLGLDDIEAWLAAQA